MELNNLQYTNINDYLRATKRVIKIGFGNQINMWQETRPAIICKDGFRLSVQAGFFAYSTPRKDDADYYTHVEVGFVDRLETLLIPYVECSPVCVGEDGLPYIFIDGAGLIEIREDSPYYSLMTEDLFNNVHSYVPVEVVDEVIEKHGGFLIDESWESEITHYLQRME